MDSGNSEGLPLVNIRKGNKDEEALGLGRTISVISNPQVSGCT